MLHEAALDELRWDPQAAGGRGAYCATALDDLGVTSTTTRLSRPTTLPGETGAETDADAQSFDERVRYAVKHGSFLALTVAPRWLRSTQRRLVRRFGVRPVSVETLLIREMKRVATEAGADWEIVRRADAAGPTGDEWRNLLALVGRALPAVEAELAHGTVPSVVAYPGLLARYGRLDVLERLRDQAGRLGGSPGSLLLIPADEQHEMPVIDGHALPVTAAGQWARVPDTWVADVEAPA